MKDSPETRLKYESIKTFLFKFPPSGYLIDSFLVSDAIAEDAHQRLPHVPIQRISHKNQFLASQSLQKISCIQTG